MADGWAPDRIEAFRRGFTEFVGSVYINSKELGGHTCLGDHIYRAQSWFLESIYSALAEGQHELFILKSRQLGVSTISRALSLFWLGVHQGLQGAFVFDTAYNTAAARREIINIIQNLPTTLGFPRIRDNNRDALILENDSQILFMAAGVKQSRSGGGLGRSVGLNFCHCSEICSWNNDEGVTSFRQSLSENYPDRLYIWESTARGFNIWHDMYQEALDDDAKRAVFLGWWSKDNQIIKRGSVVEFQKYGTQPPTPSEVKRIHAVRDLYDWEISVEQLAWYRKKSDPTQDHEEGDEEDSNLIQEQPWTADEAWQQTGSSFFESEVLTENSVRISAAPRPQVYKFLPGVSSLVECDWMSARFRRDVELRIWEEPFQDSTYVVAGDPAFGHNENNNNSAVQVLRCFADGIDQVAEYASATIRPHQFAWLLWSMVGYYGSKANSTVMMICELNGPGEEVWRQYQQTRTLIQTGYLRAQAEKKGIENITANARNYIFQRSDTMGTGHNLQWVTSTQRKVQIMEALRNYLNSGTLLVRSMEAIEEMKAITREGDSIGAPGAKRDDRSFSLALGIRAWDEKYRRGLVAGNRTREAERARLSASIVDQYALYSQNQLMYYLKDKERARHMLMTHAARSNWRAGSGTMRRPAVRRF